MISKNANRLVFVLVAPVTNEQKKSLTNQSTSQKPALAGSGNTSTAIVVTLIEPDAAGSFLWLLSFAEKESDCHWLT